MVDPSHYQLLTFTQMESLASELIPCFERRFLAIEFKWKTEAYWRIEINQNLDGVVITWPVLFRSDSIGDFLSSVASDLGLEFRGDNSHVIITVSDGQRTLVDARRLMYVIVLTIVHRLTHQPGLWDAFTRANFQGSLENSST